MTIRAHYELLFCGLAVLVAANGCSRKAPPEQVEIESQFAQMMKGATLVGHSTRLGKEGVSGEEKYHIESASRLTGDTWILRARIQYGAHDLPVPVPMTIKWAGDTPVITLTDVSIPGMGTYTARVLLYRDQYAGTWSGKAGGGQLFGKIMHGR